MSPDLSKLPVCGQDWETMEPLADGRRLCPHCTHLITELRSMSKKKITLAHVMSGQRICGACTPSSSRP
ncbi:MAG TPA: hypothetical protein VGB15_12700 [Longimicrobium sp.]|jgi:hypothetical protein